MRRKLLALFVIDPEAQRELERQLTARRLGEKEVARLLRLLAPLVRRSWFESTQRSRLAGIPIEILRERFAMLDATDPTSARILDMRHVARLNIEHIAGIVHLSPEVIRRELRHQKRIIKRIMAVEL
jgi:hypothetical protein